MLIQFCIYIKKKIKDKADINYLKFLRDETYILNEQLSNKNFDYIPISINKSWELKQKFNYKPSTSVIDGISNFVTWYKKYYKI